MKNKIKTLAAPLLCGLFVLMLLRFAIFIGYVPSVSMEPTICAGSYVVGSRLIGDIRPGDILVFEQSGTLLVKRTAAVPGDIVYIDDARLTIAINAYLPGHTRALIIPENHYFMLGDNGSRSVDSRIWDEPFVSRQRIVAILFKR